MRKDEERRREYEKTEEGCKIVVHSSQYSSSSSSSSSSCKQTHKKGSKTCLKTGEPFERKKERKKKKRDVDHGEMTGIEGIAKGVLQTVEKLNTLSPFSFSVLAFLLMSFRSVFLFLIVKPERKGRKRQTA